MAIIGSVRGVAALRYGDQGPSVAALQDRLSQFAEDSGDFGVEVDGKFGRATEAAVKQFQKQSRLPADGIVSPGTWSALEAKTGSKTSSTSRGDAARSKPTSTAGKKSTVRTLRLPGRLLPR